MILVKTQLDNSSRLLKPGMTGKAKIYCGKQNLHTLITRSLFRSLRVELWSWW